MSTEKALKMLMMQNNIIYLRSQVMWHQVILFSGLFENLLMFALEIGVKHQTLVSHVFVGTEIVCWT